MAEVVYLLSMFTSLLCVGLLVRAYRIAPTRLLFWSAVCFFGLALNNLMLFVDLILFPDLPLSGVRAFLAVAAIVPLLYGLIVETT